MAGDKRDLIVSQWEYAYLRDGTKGTIKVFTGPTVVTPSAQDEGIVYEPVTGKFVPCADLSQAKRSFPIAEEGSYCVLQNPAKNRKQPDEGGQSLGVELEVGRKINIPGPCLFPLWPGQAAEVIPGHQLRYNQYLIARVYNEAAARENWTKAVVKPATTLVAPLDTATEEEKAAYQAALRVEAEAKVATALPPKDLTVGKLLIIRGTEVSFYIPPTGISVVTEGLDEQGKPQYVREALTLERLEYAILLDENGNKRYVNGPTVVFPAPTERFMEGRTDEGVVSRKFRAIELNELQGLHLKVIADFRDEKGVERKAGEELFITGKDTAIYYPREEVSAVKYDGKTKHFASAVPVGEGRYVLNRMTGEIVTSKGPDMLLPDPRTEVIVRRVLTERQCQDWYPGNTEVLQYNQNLREILKQVPTTRGAPSEGDVARNYKAGKGGPAKNSVLVTSTDGYGAASNSTSSFADSSRVSKEQAFVGDEFVRASNFTQPRTLTLDTKYQGVPTVEVWTGYAVLVVSKHDDKRRVVKGPSVVLLDYDESFEVMELSRGMPKTTDKLLRTIFLRTENNQVSDTVHVETSDYVAFDVHLRYCVNFEGEGQKWWAVENYVKFLCDRMRSELKAAVKKLTFAQFRPNATEILQSVVLGPEKSRLFAENNMRVADVEVLEVECRDNVIEGVFKQSAHATVKTNIELEQLKRGLVVTREKHEVIKEELVVRADTEVRKSQAAIQAAAAEAEIELAKTQNERKVLEGRRHKLYEIEDIKNYEFEQDLVRRKRAEEQLLALKEKAQELVLAADSAEADNLVKRFAAAGQGLDKLAEAVMTKDAAVEIAQALNMQRSVGGESFAEAVSKVLGAIPMFAPLMQKVASNGASQAVGMLIDKKPTVGA